MTVWLVAMSDGHLHPVLTAPTGAEEFADLIRSLISDGRRGAPLSSEPL